jgi:phage FluMu protein Com
VARLIVGAALVSIGLGIIVLVKLREPKPEQKIVHQVELPGDLNLEQLRCRSCSAALDKESISLRHGAITVACPYCGSVYQIEEEPKW